MSGTPRVIRYPGSDDDYEPMRTHARPCDRSMLQHTDPRDPDYEDFDNHEDEEL